MSFSVGQTTFFELIARLLDLNHCYHRFGFLLCHVLHAPDAQSFSGPKTNSVEKLRELRRAGVNVGACFPILERASCCLSYSVQFA